MIRFAGGIAGGRSANGSCKPQESSRAYIELQWQVYNTRSELAKAQVKIQGLQHQLDDVAMLVDVLQGNGVLMDMMSDADPMVVKHVLGALKKGESL